MYGKEFLKTADIAIILDIGRTRAMDIMHMFLQSGRGIKIDGIYRVRSEIFHRWHSQHREILPTRQFRVIKGADNDGEKVQKDFLKAADIKAILDIGQTKALKILQLFISKEQGVKFGRIYRVERDVFYDWLADMDGYRPERKLRAV